MTDNPQRFPDIETWAVKAYTILFTVAESDPSPEVIKEAAERLVAEAPIELEMVGSLSLVALLGEFADKGGLL